MKDEPLKNEGSKEEMKIKEITKESIIKDKPYQSNTDDLKKEVEELKNKIIALEQHLKNLHIEKRLIKRHNRAISKMSMCE